jgi:hypothetical protein
MSKKAKSAGLSAVEAIKALENPDKYLVIQELGELLAQHTDAEEAITAAQQKADDLADQARDARARALKLGWTAADLSKAGLRIPAAPSRRRTDSNPNGGTDSSSPAVEKPAAAADGATGSDKTDGKADGKAVSSAATSTAS